MNYLFIKGIISQVCRLIALLPTYIKFKLYPNKYSLEQKFEIINKHCINTLKDLKVFTYIEGKENLPEGNVLFVANHSNWIDAFILLSIVDRPTAMVIAKEANWEKFPVLSGWLDMFNCLHLDRENNRAALKTMNEASNLLKETSSVGIFPEGMVTRSNNIGEFKSGAFRMAIKSQVPIVPILIENSKDVYIPSIGFKIGKSYSKQVSVKILPPVYDHIENPKIKSSVISDLVRNTLIENQEEIFEVSDADLCMETNLI